MSKQLFDCNDWEKKSKNALYTLLIAIMITVPLLSVALYETQDAKIVITLDLDEVSLVPPSPLQVEFAHNFGTDLYAWTNNASFVPLSVNCYIVGKNNEFMVKNEGAFTQFRAHHFNEDDPSYVSGTDKLVSNGYSAINSVVKSIDPLNDKKINFEFDVSSDYSAVFGMAIRVIFNSTMFPSYPEFMFMFCYVINHGKSVAGQYVGKTLFNLNGVKGKTLNFDITGVYYDYTNGYLQNYLKLALEPYRNWDEYYMGHALFLAYPFILNGTMSPRL